MVDTTSKCDTQPEYIERNKVYELIGQTGVARIHVSDIDVIPSADVAPVRKGRWESVGLSSLKCSDCGYLDDMKMYHRYCPDCGCFMR